MKCDTNMHPVTTGEIREYQRLARIRKRLEAKKHLNVSFLQVVFHEYAVGLAPRVDWARSARQGLACHHDIRWNSLLAIRSMLREPGLGPRE